jgi:hypothetical protein
MSRVVTDTNVLIVANGQHEDATEECIQNCADALGEAYQNGLILDDESRIFNQWRKNCSFSGQPGVGDQFFRWVVDNRYNPKHCLMVPLQDDVWSDGTPSYMEFPETPDVLGFHWKDRVFVAVALASGLNPPILNATDTDWWNFREPLAAIGITVRYLCPDAMQ